ncbi:MAG: nitrophenyl compound nitroreductase subunit ArsF family protein [Candidatus Deferrimicrobium sp.]
MKGKKLLTGFLLVFVIASVGFLLLKESHRGSQARSSQSSEAVAVSEGSVPVPALRGDATLGPGKRVVAYYFHVRVRCASCIKIESLSGKAIRRGFPEELRTGLLVFREVNVEEPGNRYFIDDYCLTSQSLVIVEYRDGRQVRWKNLEKVWTFLGSEKEFISYVQESVSSYMKGA